MCLRVGHLKNYINININKLVTTKASACTHNTTHTKSFAGILSPITYSMILSKLRKRKPAMRKCACREKYREWERERAREKGEKECNEQNSSVPTYSHNHKLTYDYVCMFNGWWDTTCNKYINVEADDSLISASVRSFYMDNNCNRAQQQEQ